MYIHPSSTCIWMWEVHNDFTFIGTKIKCIPHVYWGHVLIMGTFDLYFPMKLGECVIFYHALLRHYTLSLPDSFWKSASPYM